MSAYRALHDGEQHALYLYEDDPQDPMSISACLMGLVDMADAIAESRTAGVEHSMQEVHS